MKHIILLLCIVSCTATKKPSDAQVMSVINNHYDSLQTKLIFVREPILVKIMTFIKNGPPTPCVSQGSFSYAFMTASDIIDTNKHYNIFAICDTNNYKIGETIKIKSIENNLADFHHLIWWRGVQIDMTNENIFAEVIR